MKKQLLLFAMILLPLVASADNSGMCGDNLTWSYTETDHTLNISGSGAMTNYSSSNSAPWISYDIRNLVISSGVTSIGEYAFHSCWGINNISIPNSVTNIGRYAFYGCSNLTDIHLPNSIKTIERGTFEFCKKLRWIDIPNSVTKIYSNVFYGCTNLVYILIPSSVSEIGAAAFHDCSSLKYLILEPNKCSISGTAFDGCNLKQIICKSKSALVSCIYTSATYSGAKVYVPQGTISLYRSTQWRNYSNLFEETDSRICAKPSISYKNKKLIFNSTKNATCYSTIVCTDENEYSTNEISLSTTYHIIVYAEEHNSIQSPISVATLYWIGEDYSAEGITNGIANIPANAVLIQSEGGSIKVQGVDEGTQVNVYSINGTQAGSAVSQAGAAIINTNLQPGSIAIVKIGQKSVKVVMK